MGRLPSKEEEEEEWGNGLINWTPPIPPQSRNNSLSLLPPLLGERSEIRQFWHKNDGAAAGDCPRPPPLD